MSRNHGEAHATAHPEQHHRLPAPAVLLRDTPEDRERLLRIVDEQMMNPLRDPRRTKGDVIDAIIAALRGEA